MLCISICDLLGTEYLPSESLGEASILARAVDRTRSGLKGPRNEHHEIYGAGTSFIVSQALILSIRLIVSDFWSDTVPQVAGSSDLTDLAMSLAHPILYNY